MASNASLATQLAALARQVESLSNQVKPKKSFELAPRDYNGPWLPVCPRGFKPCDPTKMKALGLSCPSEDKLPQKVVYDAKGNLCYASEDMAKIYGKVPRNLKEFVNMRIERIVKQLRDVLRTNPEKGAEMIAEVGGKIAQYTLEDDDE